MGFKELDCVVLAGDLPDHGLRKGDLGTIVDIYEPNGMEVEFVSASGETIAVVTLTERDVRKATSRDILAVRSGA